MGYVRHKAEFYFEPDHDWSAAEAREMWANAPEPRARLIVGDCIDGMNRLPEGVASTVVADPPFGINFDGFERCYNRDASNVVGGYEEVDASEYLEFSVAWVKAAARLLAPDGALFAVSGWSNLKDVLIAVDAAGLETINHVVWHHNFPVFTSRKWASSHYHIIYAAKTDRPFFNRLAWYDHDVWDIPKESSPGMKKNATKLPTDLVQKMVEWTTRPGDLVVDPFMGNGTTAVAAARTYRRWLGFEINPGAAEVIRCNVAGVEVGVGYTPYGERIPSAEELRKKSPAYERAYQAYVSENQAE